MKCTTELHGGVCHRTSTPHKSGNKMKEKKKKNVLTAEINYCGYVTRSVNIECMRVLLNKHLCVVVKQGHFV